MSNFRALTSGRKSRPELKMFVEWLANLSDDPKDLASFWKRYESYFPVAAFRVEEDVEEVWPSDEMPQSYPDEQTDVPGKWMTFRPMTPERKIGVRNRNLLRIRDELREVWAISEGRRKEWKLFLLREKFHQITAAQADKMLEPPAQCGLDDGLRCLLRVMPRTKICENGKCVARYFIANRSTRKTCSPECAGPGRKLYQEKRWAKRKDQRNRRRRLEYRRRKRGEVRRYTRSPAIAMRAAQDPSE